MQNHFKVVCKLTQWQQQDHLGRKTIHDIGQENDISIDEPDEQDSSFDVVRINYINLYSIRCVIFTKLESSTSQR